MDRNTIETILTALIERKNRLISTQVNEHAVHKMRAKVTEINRAIREMEAMRNADSARN